MPRAKSFLKQTVLASLLAMSTVSGPAHAQQDSGAYLAARIAAAEFDYRAAAIWFGRAILRDPANPTLLDGAVIANIGIGNFAAAAEASRQLIAAGGKSQQATIAIMTTNAKAADHAAILKDLAAGNTVGGLIDGLVSSWAELGVGNMTGALAGFDKVTATKGLEAFGLYHKALALAQAGDFEGADNILSGRAAGNLTLTRRGIIAYAQILSQLERNPDATALLERSFPNGQDPQVNDLVRRLAAGEPVPFDIVRNATEGIAEVFFSVAVALNGEADSSYTLLYTRVALHLRPDHTEAILLTGSLLEQQDQHEMATEAYALIPATDPAFYVAEIGRAEATYAAGRKEASIEILQALTRSHPTIISVHVSLADALRRDERFVEALKAYDTAIGLIAEPNPSQWAIYYARGICHERQDDFAKAETDMRRALALNPDQPQVLNYLGYSFVDRGENLEEALGMIERAVAAQPDSGYIIDSLAWAYFRLGRYDEALKPMEQASLLEPVDPIVTDHLGDVYWAVGRTLEAEFQWHRALSFDPVEKDAARIRLKLEIGLDAVLAKEGAPPIAPVQSSDATSGDGN